MDGAVARARLVAFLGGAEARPALSDSDVTVLLDMYRMPDDDGAVFGDADYVPTWDLAGAAAEGWRWKAGRVAGDFNFSADNASYSKGDVMARCLAMASQYEAKRPPRFIAVGPATPPAPYDARRLLVN